MAGGAPPRPARRTMRARPTRGAGAVRERAGAPTAERSPAVGARGQTAGPRLAHPPPGRGRRRAAPHAGWTTQPTKSIRYSGSGSAAAIARAMPMISATAASIFRSGRLLFG